MLFMEMKAQTLSHPEEKQAPTRPWLTHCENTHISSIYNPSCSNEMITPCQENSGFSTNW